MKMFTKTKIALVAAIIVGAASASLAEGKRDQGHGRAEGSGYQVQTWPEIQRRHLATGVYGSNAFDLGSSQRSHGGLGTGYGEQCAGAPVGC
jgi:hypothetical protein